MLIEAAHQAEHGVMGYNLRSPMLTWVDALRSSMSFIAASQYSKDSLSERVRSALDVRPCRAFAAAGGGVPFALEQNVYALMAVCWIHSPKLRWAGVI